MALACGGLLGGCGSSNPGGTSADPANAVPASAVLYAGATVRPTGTLKAQALAVGGALTHQADPYLRLLGALQTPGSATLDFTRDVAPWLGPRAGVFLTSLRSSGALPTLLEHGLLGSASGGAFPFGPGGAEGALVLDTSNAAKARSFLHTQAAHAGAHPTSYRGVSYEATASGVSFGLVDRFAVIGSETGMHGVIEATHGGSSSSGDDALAHAAGYAKLAAAAPAGALAHLYTKPAGSTPVAGGEALSGILQALSAGREANVSLVPALGSAALDADTLASTAASQAGGLLSADPEDAQAFDELPGESWLAIGLGHVGATLSHDVQDIQGLVSLGAGSGPTAPAAGLSVGSLLQGLLAPLQVLGANSPQAKRAFTSWMGSAGVYASGASLLELHAAVVITSKDPALSHAAVAALADQLRRSGASVSPASIPGTDAAVGVRSSALPLVLDIANGRASDGQTKFVLGLGEASVTSALHPTSTLAGAGSRSAAAASLGEGIQPSLMVSFPTLLSLLEGVGLLEQPPISQFVPYLRAATTLAGGGHQLGGEVQRFRLAVGLR
ncbi:MAG TPA: DUF3352 domain-containing protein [Solirubrobacteraceae bacterium]|nr:DUF3352 domain-containing protein [Solirubrobacteraceae bacterium]